MPACSTSDVKDLKRFVIIEFLLEKIHFTQRPLGEALIVVLIPVILEKAFVPSFVHGKN
jgi:hypothetical protein